MTQALQPCSNASASGVPVGRRRFRWRLSLLRLSWTLLLASIAGLSAAAAADNASATPSPAEQAITLLLEARVGYEADSVTVKVRDSAAQLDSCEGPAPFLPREDTPLWGRVTVGVECNNPPSPRYLQARVVAEGSYVTAATGIERGTRIEPWMLTLTQGDLGSLPARTLRDPSRAVGQEARQRLREGAAVQEHQLSAPVLVTRGQAVVIEAQGPGFRIHRDGEALDSGGLGDQVRVRLSRSQTLTATVSGSGRVSTMNP